MFEVYDEDKNELVWFMPNKYLGQNNTENYFKPQQETCWYDSIFRLSALQNIQTPFILKTQTEAIQNLAKLSSKISMFSSMEILCSTYKSHHRTQSKIDPQKMADFFYNVIKVYNTERLKSFPNFLTPIESMLKENQQELTNHLEKVNGFGPEGIEQYFKKQQELAIDEFLQLPCVLPLLQRLGINSTLNLLESSSAIKHNTLELLCTFAFGIEYKLLGANDLKDPKSFKSYLEKYGPILVKGHVGTPFYHLAKPKLLYKKGSIDIYSFPKGSYKADEQNDDCHYVIVIGIIGSKVIYLDPVDFEVNQPIRQRAFAMELESFIVRSKNSEKENLLELFAGDRTNFSLDTFNIISRTNVKCYYLNPAKFELNCEKFKTTHPHLITPKIQEQKEVQTQPAINFIDNSNTTTVSKAAKEQKLFLSAYCMFLGATVVGIGSAIAYQLYSHDASLSTEKFTLS